MIILSRLKLLKIKKTPAFYIHQFGSEKLLTHINVLSKIDPTYRQCVHLSIIQKDDGIDDSKSTFQICILNFRFDVKSNFVS